MDFRTIIAPEHYPFAIDYESASLFLGSCFSDHIGQKMLSGGFAVSVNPFGILYNPVSIANVLKMCLSDTSIDNDELIFHEGLYHSLYHHGQFSSSSRSKVKEAIDKVHIHQKQFLYQTQYLFLTFGTAFVYKHIERDIVVSNCHKLPPQQFSHQLLSVSEIVNIWEGLITRLLEFNPKLKIILTVSPVRHWKNGAANDQISKSTLLLAVRQLTQIFETVYYYPAYELLMDDLRDYRFYKEDMLHPNESAISYVYEHFRASFYRVETQQLEQRVLKLKQALGHRVLHPNTESYQKFMAKTKEKINTLLCEYPYINPQIFKQ